MVGGAAGGALAGIMVANNLARLENGMKAARESWKELAARGLVLSEEKKRPVLRGTVNGVACSVEVVTDVVQCGYTRITATPSHSSAATVGLYPQPPGVIGRLRGWVGQDIQLGDEAFDQAFLVHGNPESAAHALLQPELRARVLALLGRYLCSFERGPESVTCQLGNVETDARLLGEAIDAVVLAAKWKP